MKSTALSGLSMTLTLVAGTLALAAFPAFAQQAGNTTASAADTIEEVVVTARRREENIQAVPIAVTAISGETLTRMGVSNAFDLANRVPNLIVGGASTDPTAFTVGIRGLRTKSQLLLDDPPIGTVFAESVVPHPYGFGEMVDISSVQVLKGPQGTLFGRNTTGGAVIIEPNRASIEEGLGGYVKLTLGDYNLRQFEGSINVPLNDVAAFRIAGQHKERDGFTKNLFTGDKWDNVDNDLVRASLLIKPTRDVTNHTIVDYTKSDTLPGSVRLVAVYPGGGALLGGNARANALLGEQKSRGLYEIASYQGTNGPLDLLAPYRCQANAASPLQPFCREKSKPRALVEVKGFINNTQVDFDGFSIKNILSYRDGIHRLDGSATWNTGSTGPISGVGNVAIQEQSFTDISDEFQISGKSFEQRLDWVTGLFWMEEKGHDANATFNGAGTAVPPAIGRGKGGLKNEAKGIYAQGTYALTDKLKGTLGLRRNYDERNASLTNFTTNVTTGVRACTIFNGSTPAVLPYAQCLLTGHRKWSANTWTVALDYQLADETLIYATTRKGYKAGGFFFRTVRANRFAYDPEFVRDYEVGIKSDWMLGGRPVRTNFALYRSDFTSQQVPVNDLVGTQFAGYVSNVGKSKYQGAELEVTWKPTRQLELSGFISYADAKYLSYTDPGTGADLTYQTTAQPLNHVNVGLSASYNLPLEGNRGTLDMRVDISGRSKVITNNIQPLVFSEYPQAGYALVNLRADWRRPMGTPVDLAFFASNLTKAEYTNGVANVNGWTNASVGAPRMFGVELSYKFGEGFRPKE